jgi:hypothetical protein
VFQSEKFSKKELMFNLYLKINEAGIFDYLV